MVQWGDTWAASHDEDDKDGRDDTDPSLFLRRNDVTIPPYSFRVQSPFFYWKKKNPPPFCVRALLAKPHKTPPPPPPAPLGSPRNASRKSPSCPFLKSSLPREGESIY